MKKISILIIMTMLLGLLGGCEKKEIQAPELLAPVAVNEAYRIVGYGDIGDFQYRHGQVVPMDYCHFWKTRTDVAEIKVDVGQYVEKGEVLAVADIEAAEEMKNDIIAQKELYTARHTLNCGIYDAKKQELNYRLMGYQELMDDENINATRLEMDILDENHNYDVLLYEYNITAYNKDISKYQEIISDGTLVAKTSGYVTYVKDLSNGSGAENFENIVIISDYNDCYVEVEDAWIRDSMFYYYPVCYTLLNGEKYYLNEYEYNPDELVIAGNREAYPYLRLNFENAEAMPEIGSRIPVFFQKSITENVLYVGNDSLYSDDLGNFVYVNKDGHTEKRYVEIGDTDKFNTEIKSGLEAGEMVFYSSESVLPENYKTVSVVSMDYDVLESTYNCDISNTRNSLYLSEYEGNIKNIYVNVGDYVEKGDLICTIETNESSAALVDMENQINNYKSSYTDTISNYDSQIKELENQKAVAISAREQKATEEAVEESEIATSTDATPEIATSTDAGEEAEEEMPVRNYIPEELAYQIEQVKYQKQIYELEYAYQLGIMEQQYSKAKGKDDGTGASNIYADFSGEIAYIKALGSEVEYGDRVFNIKIESDNKVVIKYSDKVNLNQCIEITDTATGTVYTGRVSGLSGTKTQNKVYLFTEDGEVCVTSNKNNDVAFYVSVEDESFYETSGEYIAEYATTSIKQTILIPKDAVHVEYPTMGPELYYVWKIDEEQLVKQYVELAGTTRITEGDINEDLLENDYVSCVIKGLTPEDEIALEVDEE